MKKIASSVSRRTALVAICLVASFGIVYPFFHKDNTLVIVVRGTWGNEGEWPSVKKGQATFGSELQRALGNKSTIYSEFHWKGGLNHRDREEGANKLASLIDEAAKDYDRVALVGHSHGGNVAMLAAGKCKRKIDMVVCLSTPHVFLRAKDKDGKSLLLPCYCPPASRKNIQSLICLYPTTDRIVSDVSNSVPYAIGLQESDAKRITREWREAKGHPKFKTPLLAAGAHQHYADENIPYFSNIYESISLASLTTHSAAHSRRMGFVVGELIRDGATPERLSYLESLAQPSYEDDGGEPVNSSNYISSVRQRDESGDYVHSGWLLKTITVTLKNDAKFRPGGKPRCLVVKLIDQTNRNHYGNCPEKQSIYKWSPAKFFRKDEAIWIQVEDDYLGYNKTFGNKRLSMDTAPNEIESEQWSARLEWIKVHF